MTNILIIVYFVLAAVISLFYSFCCMVIFTRLTWKDLRWTQRIHQFWFNAIGSFAGWTALFYLIFIKSHLLTQSPDFTIGDATLLIIGLLGVTGHLPSVLIKINIVKDVTKTS